MEELLTSTNEEVPVVTHTERVDPAVQRVSLQLIRLVIPVAIVYYAIPFMVDGYIYETRLRDFVDEVRTLRDIVEGKINEGHVEAIETRLQEATRYFDRALKRIEERYREARSPSGENGTSPTGPQSVQLLGLFPKSKPISKPPPPDVPSIVRVKNVDGEDLVWAGKRWLGTPYSWGGTEMWYGTDCSGFTQGLYRSFGVELPRTARQQFNKGLYVPRRHLQPGDLVFFTTIRPGVSHVGIYAGAGKFIHASSGTGWVKISSVDEPYFTKRYLGARRIIG